MPIQEYVVRERDDLWEVWLGERLVSGQPTRGEALMIAETLVQAVVDRGGRAESLQAYPGEDGGATMADDPGALLARILRFLAKAEAVNDDPELRAGYEAVADAYARLSGYIFQKLETEATSGSPQTA